MCGKYVILILLIWEIFIESQQKVNPNLTI